MENKGIFKVYKETRDKIKHRGIYIFGLITLYLIIEIVTFFPKRAIFNNFGIDFNIILLISTIVPIIIFIGYSVIVGKHSIKNLGFDSKFLFKNYSIGLIFGFLAFSFCMAVGIVFGFQVTESNLSNVKISILLYLIGFIIQGMQEEIMLRGVIFPEIASKFGVKFGIIGNSLLFAIMHGTNPNFEFISFAFLNLILFGIFASMTYYYTENMWFIGAFHTIWNFAQGNIYGIRVSGIDISSNSIFSTTFLKMPIFTGGEFGTEGGFICTTSLCICIFLVWYYRGSFSKMNNLEVNYEN